jgi:hypothetical protein
VILSSALYSLSLPLFFIYGKKETTNNSKKERENNLKNEISSMTLAN